MSSVLLRDFLYQLSLCSEKAACIARHIRFMQTDFNNMIQAKQLDENHQHLDADYKTLADVIIQEVIKRDLGGIYPELNNQIYGEEDGSLKLESSNEKMAIDVNGTREDILTLLKKLFNNKSTESIETLADIVSSSSNVTLSEQTVEKIPDTILVDLSNIGVWIDPVDGTQQYINGTDGITDSYTGIIKDGLPTALVLIGCFDVHNGHAVIGVINRVFNEKIDELKWKGLIFWGTALPNAKFNNLEDVYKRNENMNKQVLLHGSVDVKTFGNILNDWVKLEVAACGNKLLSVGLKQANVFLTTKSAAFNWDLCAPHAIIQSVNGQILDLRQILRYYEQNNEINSHNLSQFEIIYNNNINPNKFQPKDYACQPFIAYYNQQDLNDILQELLVNKFLSNEQIYIFYLLFSIDMTDIQISLRRNRPGTKAKDWCHWKDEVFENMDSLYHIQQYIQQSIRRNPADIDFILQAPEQQDEGIWKYEHLRQFCLELNDLTVLLQKECLSDTCSQMIATEQWIFLCAAHKNPKECSAIDYTRHTLDGAASLLNSNKYFPSRISIKDTSIAKLGSICRRIYRIFSHAYYHHRPLYDEFEARTHLCRRFTVFVLRYDLIPKDNLIVPIKNVNQNNTHITQRQQASPVKINQSQALKNDGGSLPLSSIESDA